jgi:type IV secretory pathway VirB4 component
MERVNGSVCIGEELLTLNGKPKCRASIPLEALRRHLCILGTTGSGKSTCAAILCSELARLRVPVLVLDRTGEYCAWLGRIERATVLKPGENLVMPLFKMDTSSPQLDFQIEDWVSLLDHYNHVSFSAGLSPLQMRVLREVLAQHYHGTTGTLTITDLVRKLRGYERETADLRGWQESIEALVSRLWPMTVGVVGDALDRRYETFNVAEAFAPGLRIVDLSVLPDDRARNLLSQLVLKEVYDAARRNEKTEDLRLVVLLDEAQHLAPNERGYISIPEKAATELRKYGLCLVTCATRPSLISPNVIANSNTLIAFMLNNQEDAEAVAGSLAGGDGRLRETLRRLPVGEALVQLNHPRPRDAFRCRIGTEDQRRSLGLPPYQTA